MEKADDELLKRFVAARDAQAFQELVRRHGPMVLAVCRRILTNEHDADDGFQATFLVFARKAASVRNGQIISHWLYRVAVNASRRVRKRVSRLHSPEQQVDASSIQDARAGVAADPMESLVDEEIGSLPSKFRDVLLLCCMDGKSYAEAAAALRCSESTIRNRLARARGESARAAGPPWRQSRVGDVGSPLLCQRPSLYPFGVAALHHERRGSEVRNRQGRRGAPAAHTAKSVLSSMMAAKAKLIALFAIFLVPVAAVPVVIQQVQHAKHVHAPSDPKVHDPRFAGARGRKGSITAFVAAQRQLTINDRGEKLTYTLPDSVSITADDEPAALSELQPGRDAVVVTRDGKVTYVMVSHPSN